MYCLQVPRSVVPGAMALLQPPQDACDRHVDNQEGGFCLEERRRHGQRLALHVRALQTLLISTTTPISLLRLCPM